MNKILFTGGGTAGHVTPNLSLIQKFKTMGWDVTYIGSRSGQERNLIERLGIHYYPIFTGKLRRYFSLQTLLAPLLIVLGIIQAFWICFRLKPDVMFSKGGYVAFPAVVGAWLNRVPVVIHESDLTPGLANKLCFPFAKTICVTFPEGKNYIPSKNTVVTGPPIRESLFSGQPEKGRNFCQFNHQDPVLLVLGGGQGSTIINQTIRSLLPRLIITFQVAHICGKGKVDATLISESRYRQFEYINEELADIFACSDLVVSRSGSNALFELLSLRKPHILIPLSLRASRGDQIVNADYFAAKGLSHVLYEEHLTEESLLALIGQVFAQKDELRQRLLQFSLPDSNELIYKEILQACQKQ